ncbi:MAG: DivIVA domain-containing protein [Bacillota bacterium]|nr:DivIVA domain-containing protein [Bacillota bacterium]
MIKPADIQEKEFTRSMRGYKEEEVNEFLDQITIDMDTLIKELKETREENNRLVEELERIRGSEGSLVETLTAAKSLMADISASADKRAEVLLKNAELDAELMRKSAREDAEALAKESIAMKERFINFRNNYKRLLESELQRFESLSGELLPELGVDDFDDLPQSAKPETPEKQEDPLDPDSLDKTYRNLKY